MYYGSLGFKPSPVILLSGQFTRVSSTAEFDARMDGSNIGSLSDVKTALTEYCLGIAYQHSRRLSFYAKYRFREYDDKNISRIDGKYDFISLGMNVSM
jgi:hypothetical protein